MYGRKINTEFVQQVILVCAVWVIFLLVLLTAPAPLPRRDPPRSEPKPPVLSSMMWGGFRYRTEFSSDGTYTANGDGVTWRGTWETKRDNDGRLILHVEERATPTNFLLWEVPLIEAMTIGYRAETIRGGVRIQIEPWCEGPDT